MSKHDNPNPTDVVVVQTVGPVGTTKARGAAVGGLAGVAAAYAVRHLSGIDLEPIEADILTASLASAFAWLGAYLRRVGPVLVRRVGLPE